MGWLQKHPGLKKRPSMKRRKEGHDYCERYLYMITLCVEGRNPLLGELCDVDDDHTTQWLRPTELGWEVKQQWDQLPTKFPQVEVLWLQLMPDHVHGILFVKERLPRHLGHLISFFKLRCTQAWYKLGGNNETQPHSTSLWEAGFNDRILDNTGQLQRWIDYLSDNPRRLWVKLHHREWFVVQQGIIIGATEVTAMGNISLLDCPDKLAVRCSRRMNNADIERACEHFLSLAQCGAVLVSPCISPGEKEVMRRAFEAGHKQIILLENGFAPQQKPSGRQFDACAEGRLLLVAPWEHHNEWRTINREQCEVLNTLATQIAHNEFKK